MTQSGQFRPIGRCVSVLASLGDRPQDTDEQQIQSHYLVFMGVSMVIAGAVWGALCALYGLWIPATFPFAYTILTARSEFFTLPRLQEL